MKPIVRMTLTQNMKVKYDVTVEPAPQYQGDILITIKFKSDADYVIAKQIINRMTVIRLLTSLKTAENHIFVRKYGYMDNSNRIVIYMHRGDNNVIAEDDPFLIQVKQIITVALKAEFKPKVTQTDPVQRAQSLPKPHKVRQAKENQIVGEKDSTTTVKSDDITDYPKAKALFDDTIKQLRLKFKKLNDDQLWAFGVAMYKFWGEYK